MAGSISRLTYKGGILHITRASATGECFLTGCYKRKTCKGDLHSFGTCTPCSFLILLKRLNTSEEHVYLSVSVCPWALQEQRKLYHILH